MSTHHRMQAADALTNPVEGEVYWSWKKSSWYILTLGATVLLAPLTVSAGAAAVFAGLTVVTLCLGHTLGMHRRLIHQSFACPRWLEYVLVYCGVLVGIAGPFRIIYLHDIRDWSQRHPRCHPFFIHSQAWWVDFWQQLNCDIRLVNPPRFTIEPRVREDCFYRFLEATWRWQQLPLAIALYAIGGWGWVVWGVGVRLCVSLTGHWLVGYLAHNRGGRTWHIEGAAVQGFNVPGFALLTMGESWHNNHHAYPESARLGVRPGEWDVGWWVLRGLARCGLVTQVATPDTLPPRPERVEIGEGGDAAADAVRTGLTRAKRIALEVLGPAPLGVVVMLGAMALWGTAKTLARGDALRIDFAQDVLGLWVWFVMAYVVMGIPSVIFAGVMECAFARGLSPRSWWAVVLATSLGGIAGLAATSYAWANLATGWTAVAAFLATGLAVGFILGATIRWRSKPNASKQKTSRFGLLA